MSTGKVIDIHTYSHCSVNLRSPSTFLCFMCFSTEMAYALKAGRTYSRYSSLRWTALMLEVALATVDGWHVTLQQAV